MFFFIIVSVYYITAMQFLIVQSPGITWIICAVIICGQQVEYCVFSMHVHWKLYVH